MESMRPGGTGICSQSASGSDAPSEMPWVKSMQ